MTKAAKRRARSAAKVAPIPFHERLTALLAARGWSSSRLAEEASVYRSSVSRLLSRQRRLTPAFARRIAATLGVTEAALLQGTDAVGLLGDDGRVRMETSRERALREALAQVRVLREAYEDLERRHAALRQEATALRAALRVATMPADEPYACLLRLRDLARLNAADLRRSLAGDGSSGDLLYEDLLDRVLATFDARDDAPAFVYVAEPRDDVRLYVVLATEARRLVGHVHAGVEELVAAWAALLLVVGLRPGVALTTDGRGATHAYVVLRVSSLRAHGDRLLADGLLGHAIRSAALPAGVVALDPALLAGMRAPRGYVVDADGVASCAWYGSGATTIVWLEDEKE